MTGNRTLTVQTGTDFFARFAQVQAQSVAGETVSAFRLTYRDRFGNLTDRDLGVVTLRRNTPTGTRVLTLAMTRLSEGVYESAPFVYTTAGTYYARVNGASVANTSYESSSGAVVEAEAPSIAVAPAAPVVEVRNLSLTRNAGQSQSGVVAFIRDEFGNDVPSPELLRFTYTNATSATGGVRASTATLDVALRDGRANVYDLPQTRFEWQGAYTLEAEGYAEYRWAREFVVNPLAAQSATFEGVPESIAVDAVLPSFTITFRDRFLNRVDYAGTAMFRNTSNATVMGSIPTTPAGLGVVVSAPQTLPGAGDFALSVSGIAAGNTLGTKGFVVRSDTSRPLVLFSIEPQSLLVGDSALHNWTLTVKGENFTADCSIYGKNNNVLFPTTFIDETTLSVTVPPELRQLGAITLEARSGAPVNRSNMTPVFIFDQSLEYHATLETISPQQPILTAQEQSALTTLQQSGQYVSVRAIKLDVCPVEILTTRELTFTVAPGVVAMAELGLPQMVGENDFYIPGYVQGDTTRQHFAVTMVDNRYIATSFKVGEKQYAIEPLGNKGVHTLAEVNPTVANNLACGNTSEQYEKSSASLQSDNTCDPAGGRNIRALILATPQALGELQSDGSYMNSQNIAAAIAKHKSVLNTAFRQSMEWSDYEKVTIEIVNETPIFWDWNKDEDYDDPSSAIAGKASEEEFIRYFYAPPVNTSISESFMSLNTNRRIRELREDFQADILAIIYDFNLGTSFGLASQIPGAKATGYTMEPHRDKAFTLLDRRMFSNPPSIGKDYLLAHEIGHLLGVLHCANLGVSASGPQFSTCFDYSYNNFNLSYGTITSGHQYEGDLLLFSSPKLSFPGVRYAMDLEKHLLNRNDAKNEPIYGLLPPRIFLRTIALRPNNLRQIRGLMACQFSITQ